MSTYIVIHTTSGAGLVVRSTDWLVVATCDNSTMAAQIADALNETV